MPIFMEKMHRMPPVILTAPCSSSFRSAQRMSLRPCQSIRLKSLYRLEKLLLRKAPHVRSRTAPERPRLKQTCLRRIRIA